MGFILTVIISVFLSTFPISSETPEPKITVSRNTGMAPFAVQAHINGMKNRSGHRVIWNFGDGSESMEGFVASHLYTLPGQYEVSLKIFKEGKLIFQKKIPIHSEESKQEFYVNPITGDDDHPGNIDLPWKSVQRLAKGLNSMEIKPYSSVYLLRGQAYQIPETIELKDVNGPINLSAYGNGDPPKLFYSGENELKKPMVFLKKSITDLRFIEWEWDGNGNDITGIEAREDCQNILFYKNSFHGVWSGIIFSGQNLDTVFVFQSEIRDTSGVAFYFHSRPVSETLDHSRIGFVGNKVLRVGNHLAYLEGINNSIFYKNHMGKQAYGRHFRINGENVRNVLVKKNYFEGWKDPIVIGKEHGDGRKYNWAMIHLGPNTDTYPLQHSKNIEFSYNIIKDFRMGILLGGGQRKLVIHNNLFFTNDPSASCRICFKNHVGTKSIGNSNIRISNNIFITRSRGPILGLHNYPGTINHSTIKFFGNTIYSTSETKPTAYFIQNDRDLLSEFSSNTNYFYHSTRKEFSFQLDSKIYSLDEFRNNFQKEENSQENNQKTSFDNAMKIYQLFIK